MSQPEIFPVKIIGHIHTEFATKFGVPRQSGLAPDLMARIVFEPEYRNADALRGLQDYSHLWLIWQFSRAVRSTWSPTVRPPRLGGNTRMGVFATRSPFRPNAIGLSSVELDHVEAATPEGPVIWVRGADLMDGTPILDIKPYLPFTDSHPNAKAGFTQHTGGHHLAVEYAPGLWEKVPREKREALTQVLAQDPRPVYQDDPDRVYGMEFAGFEVHFTVHEGLLRVTGVENCGKI